MSIKIYQFGSCRSRLGPYVNNNIKFINNIDCTHTLEQVLQYIDIYKNKTKLNEMEIPTLFLNNVDANIDYYMNELNSCDYILIEISSMKNAKYKDCVCQLDRLTAFKNNCGNQFETIKNEIVYYNTTEEEIYTNLEIIKKRTNKKIILMGHINLKFDNFEPFKYNNFFCKERQQIDNILLKSGELKIFYSEVFPETNWKIICNCENNDDIYHLTEYAYKQLGMFLTNVITINSN